MLVELTKEFGSVPPPWIYAKDSHPYSMRWRMGHGESYMMAFLEWWEGQALSEADRIEYYRKWPAPPRWMAFQAETIWDLEPSENEDGSDYAPYFKKLEELGFNGVSDYHKDLADEKWLDMEGP